MQINRIFIVSIFLIIFFAAGKTGVFAQCQTSESILREYSTLKDKAQFDIWKTNADAQRQCWINHVKNPNIRIAGLMDAFLPEVDLKNFDFSKVIFTRVYLKGSDLQNANLSNTKIIESDFGGVNLTDANLSNSEIKKSGFEFTKLTNANFSNSTIGTDFYNVDLSGASFYGTKFESSRIIESKLVGSDFRYAKNVSAIRFDAPIDLSHANFSNADLTDVHFSGCELIGATFNETKLTNASFRSAGKMTSATFENVDLRTADFGDVNLDGVSFGKVLLNRITIWNAKIKGAKISRSKTYYTNLDEWETQDFDLWKAEGGTVVD